MHIRPSHTMKSATEYLAVRGGASAVVEQGGWRGSGPDGAHRHGMSVLGSNSFTDEFNPVGQLRIDELVQFAKL